MATDTVKANASAYLRRIGYDGIPDGSADSLARLQECHLHAVPYENLDILEGKPLSLEIQDLFDKIVTRRRGGYCFELNALFGWLLSELGYGVTDHFARFWRDEPNPPPKRRHHVLKVVADGKPYLCDVGVGGIVPRRPILLVEGLEQPQSGETYKMGREPFFGWMLYEMRHGEWQPLYSFTEEPQLPRDYVMASYWCENAPDSIFRKGAMAAVFTPEGRNSLSGREFRIFTNIGVRTHTPQTEDEYKVALRTYFGLELG